MKNNIRLDISHPDKSRVEHFLNNVDESLEQISFHDGELDNVGDIIGGFKFRVKSRTAFVIVIFATSYFHANEIEAANLVAKPNISWTINGAILFGVECNDEDVAKRILSSFAGRE